MHQVFINLWLKHDISFVCSLPSYVLHLIRLHCLSGFIMHNKLNVYDMILLLFIYTGSRFNIHEFYLQFLFQFVSWVPRHALRLSGHFEFSVASPQKFYHFVCIKRKIYGPDEVAPLEYAIVVVIMRCCCTQQKNNIQNWFATVCAYMIMQWYDIVQ